MYSVMEAMENDKSYKPNFESLEDSAVDLVNYASFFVSYMRGKMEGQDPSRDFLNRKIVDNAPPQNVSNKIYVDTLTGITMRKEVKTDNMMQTVW